MLAFKLFRLNKKPPERWVGVTVCAVFLYAKPMLLFNTFFQGLCGFYTLRNVNYRLLSAHQARAGGAGEVVCPEGIEPP